MPITADTRIEDDLGEFLGTDPGLLVDALDEDATVGDLFPDPFVAAASDADSTDGLLTEADWDADSFGEVPREDLDAFVADHTDFEDWSAMVAAAGDEYLHGGSY